MGRKITAALVGAVIAYIWTSFSWMALPWHQWDTQSFKNDGQAVVAALKEEADRSGLYYVPNMRVDMKHDSAEHKAWNAKAQSGPYSFMSVRTNGIRWGMPIALMVYFVTQLLVAGMVVSLLATTNLKSLVRRAAFVSLAVTAGVFLVEVSHWNWWNFPLLSTAVNIVDVLIAWFLAGLAMAFIVKKPA